MLKFTCEKSLLVSAISVASRTVSPKSPFSVLEGIFLQATDTLMLTGYNLETGITVKVPAEIAEPGECIMPARLFFDMIRKLPDDMVTISVDNTYKVSIRCGITSFTLSAESAEEYPELTAEEKACVRDVGRRVAEASITLVKNETGLLPLKDKSRVIFLKTVF